MCTSGVVEFNGSISFFIKLIYKYNSMQNAKTKKVQSMETKAHAMCRRIMDKYVEITDFFTNVFISISLNLTISIMQPYPIETAI